ncbi:hypothetical protein BJV82DRAFT_487414, partial [Fennellomyces sp. T-0311]
MGKSKRAINPADALRKQQRKRELKKNKEDRKRAREQALAKKDTGRVKGEIQRLENQGMFLPGSAQAALAERQQKQRQQSESRKMVYDPKTNKFVPVKVKG